MSGPGTLLFTYRRMVIVVTHLLLWALSYCIAFGLRFESFSEPVALYGDRLTVWLLLLILLRLVTYFFFDLYRGLWRYASVSDLLSLVGATTLSTVLFAAAVFIFGYREFPRSVFVIEWLGSTFLVGGLRFSSRTIREFAHRAVRVGDRKRLLIIGAGNAGEMLLREIQKAYHSAYEVVGLLDDDRGKHGERIHGVAVRGPVSTTGKWVKALNVDEVVVAIPSATGAEMRTLVNQVRETGVLVRTIPSVASLLDGKVTVAHLREVQITDLLGRDHVHLNTRQIEDFLKGKNVMVTGAGGSIGSELCRQVLNFEPKNLILVERSEHALFEIHRELVQHDGANVVPTLADVTDALRISRILNDSAIDVIFHAAAHKHVPMMEWNPNEALKNNTLGTQCLAELASEHGVGNFVLISTDKAVNPKSFMGASKRLAELYVHALGQESQTSFNIVRFGNVLGSQGSVVPLFREQIANGGPVTVTHPDMERYFMTVAEASQLVLQAAALRRPQETYLLDMGEPVKIVDLAKEMIALSGLRPDQIEIVFTGPRPGEKLFEELLGDDEAGHERPHPKLLLGHIDSPSRNSLQKHFERFEELCDNSNTSELRKLMHEIVPEFPERVIGSVDVTREIRYG